MSRPEFEALYGGAAGGGKSDAILMEALRQVDKKKYKCLILRKTFPQLEELIDRANELYPKIFPKARYNESKHIWTFPSGAKIKFGSLQHTKDKTKYQGHQYQLIIFDELTHFQYSEYVFMMSRCRSKDGSIRCYVRATANPGGIGHGWVKDRFITAMEPMQRKYELLDVNGEKMIMDRIFIPASVFDNKALLENNPMYIATLAMLPEAEKKAFLLGDWDSFSGQVFSEFKNDLEHHRDRQWTHVIKPFKIPREWRRYRSYDFGYAKPFSVGWWAADEDGRLYRYRELYGCMPNQPNTGLKWTPQRIAQEIRAIEDKHEPKGIHIRGIADPSIWDASRGESVAQSMEREGVYWDPGDNKRIPGKMQMHYRLAFDDDGIPMMYIFDTCKDFIRTIPSLVYDDKDVEDVETSQEDHIYDEARYQVMENPLAPRGNKIVEPYQFNPLDDDVPVHNPYGFIKI